MSDGHDKRYPDRQPVEEVVITTEAELRVLQRSDISVSRGELMQWFEEAVTIPDDNRHEPRRYHPPSGLIFPYVRENGTRAVIKTVLHAEHENFGTDHLAECMACGEPFHPPHEQCPWCGQSPDR